MVGTADRVIAPAHGAAVFAAAGEPKALWAVPGAGHIQAFTTAAQRRRLARWLDRRMDEAPPSPASGGVR